MSFKQIYIKVKNLDEIISCFQKQGGWFDIEKFKRKKWFQYSYININESIFNLNIDTEEEIDNYEKFFKLLKNISDERVLNSIVTHQSPSYNLIQEELSVGNIFNQKMKLKVDTFISSYEEIKKEYTFLCSKNKKECESLGIHNIKLNFFFETPNTLS